MLAGAEPCTSSDGPASESRRGRNAREAGLPKLHNAMRISASPSALRRPAAGPQRRQKAKQRSLAEACDGPRRGASGLAEAGMAPVWLQAGKRRRGLPESGGEDGRQSGLKRLRCCS